MPVLNVFNGRMAPLHGQFWGKIPLHPTDVNKKNTFFPFFLHFLPGLPYGINWRIFIMQTAWTIHG
jgi:hypothetical protein